jgi:glycosyltransferase involved in cell wall biosynthesis
MKVAYLVNRYPHVSHSFIRREIAALEQQGIAVQRFSLRTSDSELVDEADCAERQCTEVVLARGMFALLAALIGTAVMEPTRFLQALRMAVRLGWHSDRGVFRHIAYLAEACVLVGRLRACGARHLHAHFGTNPAAVALLTHLLSDIPYSFTVHGPEEFDRPKMLSLSEKIRHAHFVVAISDFGRSQLCRWCPYSEWSKIVVVRCGVDATFLDCEPTPLPDSPRLVCVGRLCEQKGQLLLLDALARLAADNVPFHLTLVGDGAMRPILEERIHRLGLEEQVRITGWLSNDAVRAEILAARLFVLPSFAEGLPVVLMEALALGRPAVSTFVAGIPELMHPGESGWLVPAGSVAALADALREALRTPDDELESLGRAGAACVAEHHDAHRQGATLAAFFRHGPLVLDVLAAPSRGNWYKPAPQI